MSGPIAFSSCGSISARRSSVKLWVFSRAWVTFFLRTVV